MGNRFPYPIEEQEPWDWTPAKKKLRRGRRRPTLVSVARQAARAGIAVARYEVDQNGRIVIVTGATGSGVQIETADPRLAGIDPNEWN